MQFNTNNFILLATALPKGVTTTLNNFLTAGQLIGGALAGVLLVIAAIQFMSGGRQAVETGKARIICVIVGMVLCAGCSVIKGYISGLIAF